MTTNRPKTLGRLICGVALTALVTSPVYVAGQSRGTAENSRQDTIRLHRANDVEGLDLISSDGKKVGDIVDFALHLDGEPQIDYILVMTGGILDMGGDVRAIPADLVKIDGTSAKLDRTEQEFNDAPKVTEDRRAFLTDAKQTNKVRSHFKSEKADREAMSQRQGKGREAKDQQAELVLFSEMDRNTAIGRDGTELGRITDLWVNLDNNHAHLIEIDPSVEVTQPFEVDLTTRYQLPASSLNEARTEANEYQFDIAEENLSDVPYVSVVDDVIVEYDSSVEARVLRLKISEESAG